MALTTATISYDLANNVGIAHYQGTSITATTNIPGDLVIDTDGNKIRLGSGKGTISANGTGTIQVWVPGVGSNPASWQTYIHVRYRDPLAHKGYATKTFGPFTITTDADLADLVTEMEVPPETLGGDAWLATIDADDASQYRQQQDARLAGTIDTATANLVRNRLQLVFDGDSQTAGTYARHGLTYPVQVIRGLSGQVTYSNYGVGGQGLDGMIADAAAQIDPLLADPHDRNILVVWGGTNDLFFGNTAATTQTRLETYCAARKAAGWTVVVLTILSRSDVGVHVDYETSRQTVNTWIRANYTTWADVLVDVAADTRLGDAGDETNTLYYRSDAVHLNNNGLSIIAQAVREALPDLGILPTYRPPAPLFVPAAEFRSYLSTPAFELNGNSVGWAFDASTNEGVATARLLPLGGTPCKVELFWHGGATGDVVWQVITNEFEEGGSTAPTSGVLQQIASNPTINTINRTLMSSSVSLDPSKLTGLRVIRNAASGSDTNTQDARLVGVLLTPVTLY